MSVSKATRSHNVMWLMVLAVMFVMAGPLAAEPPEIAWETKRALASGGGHRGPWRQNESAYDFVDDPTVAIDEQGNVAVAWVDQARHDVFFQVYEPGGAVRFAKPVNVSQSPGVFSWLPRLVVAGDGTQTVYILWQEIIFSGGSHGGDILFARSTDGGKTFGEPLNLSRSLAGDGKGRLTPRIWHNGSLDLALAPNDALYAAWTEYEGTLWFSRSTDSGGTFSDPLRIAGIADGGPARAPSLAAHNDTVHLAWAVGEDGGADIRLATSANGGRSFGAPRVVHESDGHSDAPRIAVDGEGMVHLVYAESPAGAFERYHIRYARLDRNGRLSAPPRDISSDHGEQFGSLGFPALSLDGTGNIYVLWDLFPRVGGYPRGLGLTVSRNGGKSFASPTVVPGSDDPAHGVNGSQQGFLMRKLAVNRAGKIAAVVSTLKRDEASGIWLFRGQAAGR